MTSPELIDLVDINDHVIGQTTFDKAHRDGALHRFVHVLLTDPQRRLILQQRTDAPGMFYPLTFDASVGEHVKTGETYHQAALRGMAEELGISTPLPLQDFGRIENHEPPENMLGRLLVGHYSGELVFQPDEIVRIERMTLEEARLFLSRFPYLLCANLRASLSAYLERV